MATDDQTITTSYNELISAARSLDDLRDTTVIKALSLLGNVADRTRIIKDLLSGSQKSRYEVIAGVLIKAGVTRIGLDVLRPGSSEKLVKSYTVNGTNLALLVDDASTVDFYAISQSAFTAEAFAAHMGDLMGGAYKPGALEEAIRSYVKGASGYAERVALLNKFKLLNKLARGITGRTREATVKVKDGAARTDDTVTTEQAEAMKVKFLDTLTEVAKLLGQTWLNVRAAEKAKAEADAKAAQEARAAAEAQAEQDAANMAGEPAPEATEGVEADTDTPTPDADTATPEADTAAPEQDTGRDNPFTRPPSGLEPEVEAECLSIMAEFGITNAAQLKAALAVAFNQGYVPGQEAEQPPAAAN